VVGFVLAIAEDADPVPMERFPRGEVVCIPDFHAVLAVVVDACRGSASEAAFYRLRKLREVILEARDDRNAGPT
jgi:hypothetical protein